MLTDKIRREPATRADILQFYGEMPAHTVRAVVWKRGDEVIGVAGYHMRNCAVVFSDIKPDAPKFTIWREAKKYMQELNLPSLCEAECNSGRFLERLGWKKEKEGLYSWHLS